MSKEMLCDCGCNRSDFFNRLVLVETERSIDQSLTRTMVHKRFYVLAECEKPFEAELALMVLIQDLIKRGYHMGFWRRLFNVRDVLKMQHFINLRKNQIRYGQEEGEEMTILKAKRSAWLFVVPRWLTPILFKRFSKKEARAHVAREEAQERQKKIVQMVAEEAHGT